jgi:hypothetical protein
VTSYERAKIMLGIGTLGLAAFVANDFHHWVKYERYRYLAAGASAASRIDRRDGSLDRTTTIRGPWVRVKDGNEEPIPYKEWQARLEKRSRGFIPDTPVPDAKVSARDAIRRVQRGEGPVPPP